jgi:hypothetical protein
MKTDHIKRVTYSPMDSRRPGCHRAKLVRRGGGDGSPRPLIGSRRRRPMIPSAVVVWTAATRRALVQRRRRQQGGPVSAQAWAGFILLWLHLDASVGPQWFSWARTAS